MNEYMFAVNGSATVRNIPPYFKSSYSTIPFISSRRHLKEKVLVKTISSIKLLNR